MEQMRPKEQIKSRVSVGTTKTKKEEVVDYGKMIQKIVTLKMKNARQAVAIPTPHSEYKYEARSRQGSRT